jgi:hypothetical protein
MARPIYLQRLWGWTASCRTTLRVFGCMEEFNVKRLYNVEVAS